MPDAAAMDDADTADPDAASGSGGPGEIANPNAADANAKKSRGKRVGIIT